MDVRKSGGHCPAASSYLWKWQRAPSVLLKPVLCTQSSWYVLLRSWSLRLRNIWFERQDWKIRLLGDSKRVFNCKRPKHLLRCWVFPQTTSYCSWMFSVPRWHTGRSQSAPSKGLSDPFWQILWLTQKIQTTTRKEKNPPHKLFYSFTVHSHM